MTSKEGPGTRPAAGVRGERPELDGDSLWESRFSALGSGLSWTSVTSRGGHLAIGYKSHFVTYSERVLTNTTLELVNFPSQYLEVITSSPGTRIKGAAFSSSPTVFGL